MGFHEMKGVCHAGQLYGRSLDLSEEIGAQAVAGACRAVLTELAD